VSARKLRLEDTTSPVGKLPDGRWRGKVAIGRKQDGSLEYKSVTGSSERDVRARVKALERRRDSEGVIRSADDPLFKDWVREWLDVVLPLAKRSPKTISGYRSAMNVHVLPAIGAMRLSEVTPTDLTRLYAQLTRGGHSESVVSSVHASLRSCFTYGVRHKRLSSNPATGVTISKPEEIEIEPLTKEEARRLLEAARHRPNAARWAVGVSLGLRQGEVLGLLWDDIDLADGTIRVRTELQRVVGVHGCGDRNDETKAWPCGEGQGTKCPTPVQRGGLVLKKTKTKRSRRTIGLPAALVDALRQHCAVQQLERMVVGDELWGQRRDGTVVRNPLRRGAPQADLVFTAPGGRPIDPGSDWKAWKDLLSEADVPAKRVHDMRHTAATFLLIQGIDPRTVMDIMGWSEAGTAARYTHVVDELKRDAARRMGELLWPEATDGE
jgi:integrase